MIIFIYLWMQNLIECWNYSLEILPKFYSRAKYLEYWLSTLAAFIFILILQLLFCPHCISWIDIFKDTILPRVKYFLVPSWLLRKPVSEDKDFLNTTVFKNLLLHGLWDIHITGKWFLNAIEVLSVSFWQEIAWIGYEWKGPIT